MSTLKRRHNDDEEYEDSTQKAKKQKQLSTFEQCKERARQLQRAMTELGDFLTTTSLVDDSARRDMEILTAICADILQDEKRNRENADTLNYPLDVLADDALAKLGPKLQSQYKNLVRRVNECRSSVCNLYQGVLKEDTYPPSASYFAKHGDIWLKWQSNPDTAILNLRPSNNVGLPLTTLHPVFARFNVALQQSLPNHSDTPVADRTAFSLCTEMATTFQTEIKRRNAFQECVQPLFTGYSFDHEVTLEPVENSTRECHTSRADLFVRRGEKRVMGAEFKNEWTGDAHMRMSRIYQILVNQLLDDKNPNLSHGLPMMLICVIGPLLICAGGFFDGTSVIVEPLAAPCLMFPDHLRERQEALARVLAATKEAMESIYKLDYAIPASFEPGTPRVYSVFKTFGDQTVELTINSRVPFNDSQDPHRNLLFLGTSPISPRQVLIKLIVGGRYGIDAHTALANAGFAPALHGMAKVEGAPTAYVMDYLSPNDGWRTLHEHAKQHRDVKSHILTPLGRLFTEMEKHNIVHGDLRPNNIMIRRKEAEDDYELKVIDFDWAGESGKVNYPWCLNGDIPWPGRPNDPIVISHDKTLLDTYLDKVS